MKNVTKIIFKVFAVLIVVTLGYFLCLQTKAVTKLMVPQGGTGIGSATAGYPVIGYTTGTLQATSSLFIDARGNVGISSSTPWKKLSVVGDAYIDGNATTTSLAITSMTSCNLDTDASGNLVCGTDSTGTTINQLGQIGDVSTSTLATDYTLHYDGSSWLSSLELFKT